MSLVIKKEGIKDYEKEDIIDDYFNNYEFVTCCLWW